MLDALARVRGAVSIKDLVPVLTHFAFRDGTVAGFDGRLYIEARLPKAQGKLNCTVEAIRFLAAVDACQGNPQLTLQDGKLRVSKGGFTATLPVGKAEDFVPAQPDELTQTRKAPLLPALRRLRPFIGEDASRPWACGILFDGKTAYATNNVVLARTQIRQGMPGRGPVNLPLFAVDELLRIGEEPTAAGRSDHSLTFSYQGGSNWLRTTLFDTTWPKPPASLLDSPQKAWPVDKGLAEAVALIQPFCPDPKNPIIRLDGNEVSTLDGVHSAKVTGFNSTALGHCAFRAEPLLAVLAVAEHASWGSFPKVYWRGPEIDGVIVGVAI